MSEQFKFLRDGKRCFVFPQILQPKSVDFVSSFPSSRDKKILTIMNSMRGELSLQLLKVNKLLIVKQDRHKAEILHNLREEIARLEYPLFKYWFMLKSLRESLTIYGADEANSDFMVFRWKTCFILATKTKTNPRKNGITKRLASYYGYKGFDEENNENSSEESDSDGYWSLGSMLSSVLSYAPSVTTGARKDRSVGLLKEMATRDRAMRAHKSDRFSEWRFRMDNKDMYVVERGAFADRSLAFEELMITICVALFFVHRSDIRFHAALNSYLEHMKHGEKIKLNEKIMKPVDDFQKSFALEINDTDSKVVTSKVIERNVMESQMDSVYAMHMFFYARKLKKQWACSTHVQKYVPLETTTDGLVLLMRFPPVDYQRGFILRTLNTRHPIDHMVEGKVYTPEEIANKLMAMVLVNMAHCMEREFRYSREMSNFVLQNDIAFMNQSIKYDTLAFILHAEALCVSIDKNGPFLGMGLLKYCKKKLDELSSKDTPSKRLVNELIDQMKMKYSGMVRGEVDESVLRNKIPQRSVKIEKQFKDMLAKYDIHGSLKKLVFCERFEKDEDRFTLQMIDRAKKDMFFDTSMKQYKMIYMSL